MKVRELRLYIGKEISGKFVLEKITYTENAATRYQALILKDKTGRVYGKCWAEQMKKEYEKLEGKVVEVIGRVEVFRDSCELRVARIREVPADQVDPMDYYDSLTEAEVNSLVVEIGNILQNDVTNHGVQALISQAFKPERLEKLKILPAAGRMHHDYRGGWLQHALEIYRIANSLAQLLGNRFQQMDLNILAAGALLADIGALNQFEQPVGQFDSPRIGEHGRMIPIQTDSLVLIGCLAQRLPAEYRIDSGILTKILEVVGNMQADGNPSTKEGIVLKLAKELSASCSAFDQCFSDADGTEDRKNEMNSAYFGRTIRRFRGEEKR